MRTMHKMRNTAIAALAGVALMASSCAASSDDAAAGDDEVILISASDDYYWANSTIADWATMATQLSVVEVVAETDMPFESDTGEGFQGRTVTLRVVETVWADGSTPWPGIEPIDQQIEEADSADFDTAAERRVELLDGEFEFTANGWAVSGDQRRAFAAETGVRLEIGSTYLMPLLPFDSNGDWAVASFNALMPVVDGVVTFDGEVPSHLSAAKFVGLGLDEAAALYANPPVEDPTHSHDHGHSHDE